jgi:3-oxoadipate enol-lactonase
LKQPDEGQRPWLPPGSQIELPGRGVTFARDAAGPRKNSPTVLLLHGWTVTADLNWFTCYGELAKRYRVVALDHRGHGQGIRSRQPFTLQDCAQDAIALADYLGIEQFIVVGYSMGGAVAQLVARDSPDRVPALVLCSTAPYFSSTRKEQLSFMGLTGLAALAGATPTKARQWLTDQVYLQRKATRWDPWAIDEISHNDWRLVLQAGAEIGAFSSREWIHELTMPTSVFVTTQDQVVPTRRQLRLLEMLPSAEGFTIHGGHDACYALADEYARTLLRAIEHAFERVDDRSA